MLQTLKKMVGVDRADTLAAAIDTAREKRDSAREKLDGERARISAVETQLAEAQGAFDQESTGVNADAVIKSRGALEKARLFEATAESAAQKAEHDLAVATRAKLERDLAKASDLCDPSTINSRVAAIVADKGPAFIELVFGMLADANKIETDAREALRAKRRISEELGLDLDLVERQIQIEGMNAPPHFVLARMLSEQFAKREGGRERRRWLSDVA